MLNIETNVRKTSINKMKALSVVSAEIKQQFADARERVQNEIAVIQEQIQEQQKVVSETYEGYVLDLKTLDEYKAEQGNLKALQETLLAVQGKMDSLEAVQKKKIDSEVHQPMKSVYEDAQKEGRKIFKEKRDAMFKAKVEYLKLVEESIKELIRLEDATSVAIKQAEVDAGHKEILYSEGATAPVLRKLTFNDTYNGGNPVITVSESEITEVAKF